MAGNPDKRPLSPNEAAMAAAAAHQEVMQTRVEEGEEIAQGKDLVASMSEGGDPSKALDTINKRKDEMHPH